MAISTKSARAEVRRNVRTLLRHRTERHRTEQRGLVLDASAILKLVDEEPFLCGKTLLVRIIQRLVTMTQ